jgi:hypothetical protein
MLSGIASGSAVAVGTNVLVEWMHIPGYVVILTVSGSERTPTVTGLYRTHSFVVTTADITILLTISEVSIVYCDECGEPEEACICCDECGNADCECIYCDGCNRLVYPRNLCICEKTVNIAFTGYGAGTAGAGLRAALDLILTYNENGEHLTVTHGMTLPQGTDISMSWWNRLYMVGDEAHSIVGRTVTIRNNGTEILFAEAANSRWMSVNAITVGADGINLEIHISGFVQTMRTISVEFEGGEEIVYEEFTVREAFLFSIRNGSPIPHGTVQLVSWWSVEGFDITVYLNGTEVGFSSGAEDRSYGSHTFTVGETNNFRIVVAEILECPICGEPDETCECPRIFVEIIGLEDVIMLYTIQMEGSFRPRSGDRVPAYSAAMLSLNRHTDARAARIVVLVNGVEVSLFAGFYEFEIHEEDVFIEIFEFVCPYCDDECTCEFVGFRTVNIEVIGGANVMLMSGMGGWLSDGDEVSVYDLIIVEWQIVSGFNLTILVNGEPVQLDSSGQGSLFAIIDVSEIPGTGDINVHITMTAI